MATMVTLTYAVNPTGGRTAAQLAMDMEAANAPLPSWLTAITGATITSDTTAVVGAQAVRTVVLDINTAIAKVRFPTDPLGPFWGLMNLILRYFLNQPVVEGLPVAS